MVPADAGSEVSDLSSQSLTSIELNNDDLELFFAHQFIEQYGNCLDEEEDTEVEIGEMRLYSSIRQPNAPSGCLREEPVRIYIGCTFDMLNV